MPSGTQEKKFRKIQHFRKSSKQKARDLVCFLFLRSKVFSKQTEFIQSHFRRSKNQIHTFSYWDKVMFVRRFVKSSFFNQFAKSVFVKSKFRWNTLLRVRVGGGTKSSFDFRRLSFRIMRAAAKAIFSPSNLFSPFYLVFLHEERLLFYLTLQVTQLVGRQSFNQPNFS